MSEIRLGVGTTSAVDSVGTLTDLTVLPSCGDTTGMPYCASHAVKFADLVLKNVHVIEAGDHYMAWLCPLHGLEALR